MSRKKRAKLKRIKPVNNKFTSTNSKAQQAVMSYRFLFFFVFPLFSQEGPIETQDLFFQRALFP